MAGSGGGGGARDLDKTPTWAVAAVCAVIILISIFLEKILHRLELMVLGFISLLLTFGQNYIAKICISEGVADTMLPCRLDDGDDKDKQNGRRLLWDSIRASASTRRSLAAYSTNSCPSIRGWKEWEKETQSLSYEFSNDPSRFRLAHETSFVKVATYQFLG